MRSGVRTRDQLKHKNSLDVLLFKLKINAFGLKIISDCN